MRKPLKVLPRPCDTCPYAKATPPGIWSADEYRKLPGFDEGGGVIQGEFLCHNGGADARTNDTVCRGWLSVHRDSIPVRVGVITGALRPGDVPQELEEGLYASGAAACAAGLRGVRQPSRAAKAAIAKIENLRKTRK